MDLLDVFKVTVNMKPCHCVCSSGQSYAQQAGANSVVCGCYCDGNNSANQDVADQSV